MEGVEKVINDLIAMDFEYIVCDSPAGIESGALLAMHFADEALIVTNPEVSSVRDSDRILGILSSKTKRAIEGKEPIKEHLLITRYNPKRVSEGEMLSLNDIQEILRIELIGVIPESEAVLHASNQGLPAVHLDGTDVAEAYKDIVSRFLGEEKVAAFHRLPEARSAATHLRHQVRGRNVDSFVFAGREEEVRVGCEGTPAVDHRARARGWHMQPPIICRRCNANWLP